ncbi:arylsulfotransferase family protein [Planctomycetota bacterium]
MTGSKIKKFYFGLPLVWAALCVTAALGGYPFLYIVSFVLFCYLILFLGTKYAVWLLLPKGVKNTLKNHKIAFNITVLAGLILLFLGHQALKFFSGNFSAKGSSSSPSASLDNLRTLPYLDWVPAQDNIDKSGVTKYETDLAGKGVNLYAACTIPQAHLIDMSGKILNTWKLKSYTRRHQKLALWPLAELLANGDLLALSSETMLARLDWQSKVKWQIPMRAHHDFCVDEKGLLYALERQDEIIFWKGLPVPMLNDYITVLAPEGEIIKRISIANIMKNNVPARDIWYIYRWLINPRHFCEIIQWKLQRHYIFANHSIFDIFHTNSVKLMNNDIENVCKKGDLLILVRNQNWIGILDQQKEKVIWSWGPGIIDRPHHPTNLDNGNILIFDNGYYRGYSRIIEVDPLDKKIVWEYLADPKKQFYCPIRGSCQRLPNGNTLITDSEQGKVFEVTADGRIVWEFYNFYVRQNTKQRVPIYRMTRIVDLENYPSLRRFR